MIKYVDMAMDKTLIFKNLTKGLDSRTYKDLTIDPGPDYMNDSHDDNLPYGLVWPDTIA